MNQPQNKYPILYMIIGFLILLLAGATFNSGHPYIAITIVVAPILYLLYKFNGNNL